MECFIIENISKYFFSVNNTFDWLKLLQNFPWSVHIPEKFFSVTGKVDVCKLHFILFHKILTYVIFYTFI